MSDTPNTPDMNEDMNEEELDSTVVLVDEDGNEAAFDIVDYIDLDDQEYVVLVPQDENDDEVVILRVEPDEENEDNEIFVNEDNEDILDRVFAIFKEHFVDTNEFTDEDEDSLFTDAE